VPRKRHDVFKHREVHCLNSNERIVRKEENMEMCGYEQSSDKFFVKAFILSDLAQIVGPLTLCCAESLAQTLSTITYADNVPRYSKVEVVLATTDK